MPHHAVRLALGLSLVLAPALAPRLAQAQIRNAPNSRALEFAAYIFSAANVCGYRIGVDQFDALLQKQNVDPKDVAPRGPFGAKVQTMFALMSNQMQLDRERACLAVAGEYGPEGSVAKDVLLPAAVAPVEAKPAQ